jgi:RimJ/RimL family protein N-acetyltransferase
VKVIFLDGEKIYLRPLGRGDAELILPWVNDQEVTRTLLLHRPVNLESEEEFLGRMTRSDTDVIFGIVEKTSDRLIGVVGLPQIDYRNRHSSFGIFIGDKGKWGKGYGTEATFLAVQYAFGTLNLNRVWLHVSADNLGALRAYEKVGFRKEGVLQQHLYRDGRYLDIVTMAALREEWPPDSLTGRRTARPSRDLQA